jgi:plastocyanin
MVIIGLTSCAVRLGPNQAFIDNLSFVPQTLVIKPSTTVTWTNNDNTIHTVTADFGEFSSEVLSPGDTFTLTFPNKGEFSYHRDIHNYMKAKLIVK